MSNRPHRVLLSLGLATTLAASTAATTAAQDADPAAPSEATTTIVFGSEIESPDAEKPTYSGTIDGPAGEWSVPGSAIEGTYELVVPADVQVFTLSLSDPGPDWKVTDIKCEADGINVVDVESRSASLNLVDTDLISGCVFHIGSGLGTLVVHRKPENGNVRPSATIEREDGQTTVVPSSDLLAQGGAEERYPPGSHTATLDDPGPDWVLTSVDCTESIEENFSDGDVDSRTATLGVDAGDSLGCIFEVSKRGEVTIKAKTTPRGKEGEFSFSVQELDGDTLLARGKAPGNKLPLRPGISHAELNDPGDRWTLTDVTCKETFDDPLLSIGAPDADTAVLGVDPDDKIECTFHLRDETVPTAGKWRVAEVGATGRCKGQPVDIEPGPTETFTLRVRNKGKRLDGTGSRGHTRMTRRPSDDGRYKGRLRRGITANWTVKAHDHIVGSTTSKQRDCTFVRKFDMRLIED